MANLTTNADTLDSTVIRCRAQEVSQGQAIWILFVLGISSVVQQPGSLILLGHRGIYRLVPEFGVLEALWLLLIVIQGRFGYGKSFSTSLKAAFALRHFLGEGQSWWLDTAFMEPREIQSPFDDQTPDELRGSEYLQDLKGYLHGIQTYSHARLIATVLTTIAFTKACVITGTVRTTFLAASFYIPFIIVELLSWLCLRVGPHASHEDVDDLRSCARLMQLLDPFKYSTWTDQPSPPLAQRYSAAIEEHGLIISGLFQESSDVLSSSGTSSIVIATPFLLLALVLTFWPVNLPFFVVAEYTVVQRGHWTFWFLTSFIWVLALVGAWLLACAAYGFWYGIRGKGSELMERGISQLSPRSSPSLFLAVYIVMKCALTGRLYLTDYTGINTYKPDWIDWLG